MTAKQALTRIALAGTKSVQHVQPSKIVPLTQIATKNARSNISAQDHAHLPPRDPFAISVDAAPKEHNVPEELYTWGDKEEFRWCSLSGALYAQWKDREALYWKDTHSK